MNLQELAAPAGAKHRTKRVGRGLGSGHGKTCGRGTKGDQARGSVRPGFEGGQTPLYMRLRKHRGRAQNAMPQRMFKHKYAVINVADLQRYVSMAGAQSAITPQLLLDKRVVRKLGDGLRVLGEGDLTSPLTIYAQHFSKAAKEKIEAAGGRALLLPAHALTPQTDAPVEGVA